MPRKTARIYEVDVLTALTAQVEALTGKINTMGVRGTQSPFVTCDLCNENHSSDRCSLNYESVQYMNNFNRQQNNPNLNYYNAGWKNHPNFS